MMLVTSMMFSCKPEPEPQTTGSVKVTTSSVSNITETSAKCGGIVTATGYSVGSCGLCYGKSSNPTIDSYITSDLVGTGSFTSTMSDLEPGTKYYVRAYATTDSDIFYGEQKEFTTLGNNNGGNDTPTNMRKIKRIYRSDGNEEQIWSWNNDKLLRIDYYWGGDYDGTATYSYNSNGQLTRIDCNIYGSYYYYECKYNNNKLSKILGYWGDEEEIYTLKYNGAKISEIEMTRTYYDYKKTASHSKEKHINPLEMFLPKEVCQSLNKRTSRISSADSDTGLVKLEWNGDNISRLEMTASGYEDDGEYVKVQSVIVYRYDNKINPFYNHLEVFDGAYSYFFENISRNNIKYEQETETESWSEDGITWESDTYEYESTYEYTYDGEYPISFRRIDIDDSTITYFEYE